MTETIAIRKKVAALCGFTDINWYSEPFHALLKGFKFGLQVPIPKYDTSLDAITKVFDEHKLTWFLDSDGYAYHVKNGLKTEAYAKTPALALCKLFIELMEANKKALLNNP